MDCSCFVSVSASSHSQHLLWHLPLCDIFILVRDPHFAYNLRVPTYSSQACSLTFPSSLLLHFFILFFFFYSSSLTSFSFFSLLNIISLVPIMNQKICLLSARNTLDAHPSSSGSSQSSCTFSACFIHSCATASSTETGTYQTFSEYIAECLLCLQLYLCNLTHNMCTI